jgi:hypothetical protein
MGIFEIAGQDKRTILLCIVPAEAEESVLGLEVTDLQRTPDLGVEAGAAGSESQFRSGQRQIGQPLAIIEVGQPVTRRIARRLTGRSGARSCPPSGFVIPVEQTFRIIGDKRKDRIVP